MIKINIVLFIVILFGCFSCNKNCNELIKEKALDYYDTYKKLDTIFVRIPVNDKFKVKTTILKECHNSDWFLYQNKKDLVMEAVILKKERYGDYIAFHLKILSLNQNDVLVMSKDISKNDFLDLPLNYMIDITSSYPKLNTQSND